MPKKASDQLQQQATQIAAEIFNLINQYTHDSAVSKFFLPEEVSESLYVTAGGFASNAYTPQLELEAVKKTAVLPYFLVLITYGFQIYLKERSIKLHAAPYRFPTDAKTIRIASEAVLQKAVEGEVISTPLADRIIEIILKQIEKNVDYDQYALTGYTVHKQRMSSYSTVALYYGYNLASVLINKAQSPK